MSALHSAADRFDITDERLARVAWSRLVEARDREAAAAFTVDGPIVTLRRVLSDDKVPARWRVRLPELDPLRDLRAVERLGGHVLIPGDDQWPVALDDLGATAPACLWVRGTVPIADATGRSVAIVGARAATAYGEHVASELAAGAVDHGYTVVSGGAYGIDGAAHRGALAGSAAGSSGAFSGGATTIAVLAGGVDRLYPRGHDALLREIVDRGAVISEVPPGASPTRWRFLDRNRIIAALSGATVVVEAALRSGALSTAAHAHQLMRPLAAVPGPVTSQASSGCHSLLRDGAVCVTDPMELIELASGLHEVTDDPIRSTAPAGNSAPSTDRLRPQAAARRQALIDALDPLDARVFDAMPARAAATVGAIARAAGFDEPAALAALGRCQLSELVTRTGRGWARTPGPR